MKKSSYHILRVGMAITFLWIGLLILRDPMGWATGFIKPWAAGLLPVPIDQAMVSTAILDIIIGILLLVDMYVWFAALVAAAHLVIVLTVSGIDDITVRDIALLAAAISLAVTAWPQSKTKNKIYSSSPALDTSRQCGIDFVEKYKS